MLITRIIVIVFVCIIIAAVRRSSGLSFRVRCAIVCGGSALFACFFTPLVSTSSFI
jgi:hypothetical protein